VPKSTDTKKTAETTAAEVPEQDSQTQPEVTSTTGFLVCTKKDGSIQIHLIKDEDEEREKDARDAEAPRVDEVRSKVLALGQYVAVAEVQPELVEAVQAGEVEELVYAEDERDVKIVTMEAQTQQEFVTPSRVYYTAEKQIGKTGANTFLVGAAARS
jgi:hypothetical protein